MFKIAMTTSIVLLSAAAFAHPVALTCVHDEQSYKFNVDFENGAFDDPSQYKVTSMNREEMVVDVVDGDDAQYRFINAKQAMLIVKTRAGRIFTALCKGPPSPGHGH